jgi:DNA polymerase-3 subunit delta'
MNDWFSGFVGQHRLIQALSRSIESDKISHAYLFVGEPNLGKTTLARMFASAILKTNNLKSAPDYWEDDGLSTLSVDDLHSGDHSKHALSLEEFVCLSPVSNERKVAIISDLSRIQLRWQNSLLKLIEEPGPGTVLLMTVPSLGEETVLPTIVSRCRLLKLYPLQSSELERLADLYGLKGDTKQKVMHYSLGRPGRLIMLAKNNKAVSVLSKLEEHVRTAMSNAWYAMRFVREICSSRSVEVELDNWKVNILAEVLNIVRIVARSKILEADNDTAKSFKYANLLYRTYRAEFELKFNVTPRLVLENLFLES